MAEKTIKTRIQQKMAKATDWAKATFTSKKGEIYFYEKDETHDYVRMKVGDGESTVGELDFFDEGITNEEIDEICITRKVGCYITKAPGSADFTVNGEPYDPNREYTPGEYVDICLTDEGYIEEFYNISVINNTSGEDIAQAGIHMGGAAVEVLEMPADGITVNFARPERAPYIARLVNLVEDASPIETRLYNNENPYAISFGENGVSFNTGDRIQINAWLDYSETEITVDGIEAEYDGGGEWYFIAPDHDITVEIRRK